MGWQTESFVDYTYDAAGVLRTYKVDVYKTGALSPGAQYRTTDNNNYRLGESYQDAGQSASSVALVGGAQVPQSGSTTRSYNVNGELISFTDTKSAEKTRKFANGVNGQALLVVQGDITNVPQAFADALARADNSQKSQYFFFANGQQVGSFGQLQDTEGKFKANFDVNYTAISDEYPSSVPMSVIAQNNDTLRTIAARVFGDQNLWYVLAEENGLSDPDALIEEGTVIQVPNEVLSVSNSSSSFKPFNIADAIGDTTPTQPAESQPWSRDQDASSSSDPPACNYFSSPVRRSDPKSRNDSFLSIDDFDRVQFSTSYLLCAQTCVRNGLRSTMTHHSRSKITSRDTRTNL
jgi:hypothetical protein